MSLSDQQSIQSMNTVNYRDLIIDNPEQQVAWKRLGFFFVTLAFWAFWFHLWTPLPGMVWQMLTTDFSAISFRPGTYVAAFLALLFSLAAWQVGWLHYNLVRYRNKGRRSKSSLLSNQDLGQFFTVDNSKLDHWQQSKCLVIKHDEPGEIQEIDINDFFSFAPSLPKAGVFHQDYQRHYAVILRNSSKKQIFDQVGSDFAIIIKVFCSIFKLKFVSCQLATNHLSLTIDIPASYNVDNAIRQLKTASSSIIQKKYDQELPHQPGGLNLWHSEHLVTTKKLAGQEIQQYFRKFI